MVKDVMFVLLGYLSGSILFARVFSRVFKKENMIENSRDQNPGTANAFMHGGFWCGVLTLLGDLLKGFLPVFLFTQFSSIHSLLFPLVLAAPVVGHGFPLYYQFKGGKGIAVTFGCLLGLLPMWQPVVALAFFFIFFSVVLRISPHSYRTLVTYICALLCMVFGTQLRNVKLGFALIAMVVGIRLLTSKEEKKPFQVRLLWKH